MPDAMNDMSRQDAELSRYSVTPEAALASFHNAGLPIKLRTVQRYCRKAKLACIKIDPDTREPTKTENGVYLVEERSIERRIGDRLDRRAFDDTAGRNTDATEHDRLRIDASERDKRYQRKRSQSD